MIILKINVFVYSGLIEYILGAYTMPAMFGYFTLPNKLYEFEDEVWDHLSKVSIQAQSASPEAARLYKSWSDKLIGQRETGNIHPLEFPFVRYCLKSNNTSAQSNLFKVERPAIIHSIYTQYGPKLADNFYGEISAKQSYQFMSNLCSLNAEYECAKFIESHRSYGGIKSFHPKVGNNKGAFDATFMWKDEQWYAEAKNTLHEDGNLCFISHIIAGMYWLEREGTELRKWRSLSLKGSKIDNDFRKRVIDIFRENSNLIFAEVKTIPGKEEIDIDGISVTKMQQGSKQIIQIRPKGENMQHSATIELTAKRAKWFSQQGYSISPQRAYYWPDCLNHGFWKKFSDKLQELEEKIQRHRINKSRYLGFINLELHEKYSNAYKHKNQKQKWEQHIENKLNERNFPIVLHTSRIATSKSNRVKKEVFIVNRAAVEAGFEEPIHES